MIATLPFVQKTFEHFNALCFEGMLPPVPIVLTKAGTFLGKMEYKSKRDFFGFITSHYDFRLKISTGFDLPEAELEDIVIHEMIHYYIAYRNLKDSSTHGHTFRRIMETINQEHGRHISVRHHGPQEQNLVRGLNSDIRKHYICVSTFNDGKVGITVCSSTKVCELHRSLPKRYSLSNMEWYTSLDPFFNRYPRSKKATIYKISSNELVDHLKDAIPFSKSTCKR